MSAMAAAAIPFATGGSHVVLDFSIPPWFLDTVKKIAGMRDVPVDETATVIARGVSDGRFRL